MSPESVVQQLKHHPKIPLNLVHSTAAPPPPSFQLLNHTLPLYSTWPEMNQSAGENSKAPLHCIHILILQARTLKGGESGIKGEI